MRKIDRFLVERVAEPMAHWAERHIEISRFVAARFFYVAAVAVALARLMNDTTYPNAILAGVWLLLVFGVRFGCISRMESAAKRGMPNPEKHNPIHCYGRAFSIVLVALSIGMDVLFMHIRAEQIAAGVDPTVRASFAISVLLAFATVGDYFSACDAPPPQPERRRAPDALPDAA